MNYPWTAIPESAIPRAANPVFQHMLETYVSESNKVASTWKQFTDADLAYKPHPRSSTVGDVLRHQLLSERRFFGEFLGTPTLTATEIYRASRERLGFFAAQQERGRDRSILRCKLQRIWVFGVACSTPLTTALIDCLLRILDRDVPTTNRRCHVERSRPHEFGLRGRPPVARIAKIRVPNSSPFLSFPLALCSKSVKGKDASSSAQSER